MRDHDRSQSSLRKVRVLSVPFGLILLTATMFSLSGCSSAPKVKPIYSYELPWSGRVLRADTIKTMPKENQFDGTDRLLAYLSARTMAEDSLLEQVRKLPLTSTESIGNVLDRKPVILERVKTFLRHSHVEEVGYVPGKGMRVVETAYLGADFQSLLGVTLHLMPKKKKKVLGPDTTKPGGGAPGGGGGGMPMMPMMP
jgi:hypothetical protein